jgi:hypothetical protein
MDSGRVTRSTVDRRWHGQEEAGCGGMLTGVWPPATPEHESSQARAQKREGSMGNLSRASPGLGWPCGDRAMAEGKLDSGGA